MSGILNILVLFLFYFPLTSMSFAMSMKDMQLRGTGEAYYLNFIKVYDAALYSEESVDGRDILDENISKCLYLKYSVGVDADDFITAANKILTRQFSSKRLGDVAPEIEALHKGYRDVEKGDSYTLCYSKEAKTTSLSLNGKEVVAVFSSDFAEIYFSIWLGRADPLDEKLRENLLADFSEN